MITGTFITPEELLSSQWVENRDRSTKDIRWFDCYFGKTSRVSASQDVKADRWRIHWNYNSTEVCTMEQVATVIDLWTKCSRRGATLTISN